MNKQKNITVSVNGDDLEILIRRKPNWIVLLLTGLWALAFIGIIVTLIYAQIEEKRIEAELNLFLILFLIIWFFVVKIFFWHLKGKEKITLDKDEFRIEKLGTILSGIRKFETSLIGNFRQTKKHSTPWVMRFYGISGGQVTFNYWERSKYFGQTLTLQESTKLIELINEKLKNYAQQNV